MGCLVPLLALISPRLALFALLVFTGLIGDSFDGGWVVPVLGFFLLPWTTLAYVVMWWASDGNLGFEWFLVVLAFLGDLGAYSKTRDVRR